MVDNKSTTKPQATFSIKHNWNSSVFVVVAYFCRVCFFKMDTIYNLIYVKRFLKYTYEKKIKLKQGKPFLPSFSIGKRDIYSENNWILCRRNKKMHAFVLMYKK